MSEAFLKPLHVDPLYPGELRPLSAPFRVFEFDFARPPQEGQHATNVQVWQASKQQPCGYAVVACLLEPAPSLLWSALPGLNHAHGAELVADHTMIYSNKHDPS